MHVQIDEARHQVHARRVNLVIGPLRRPVGAKRQSWRGRAADRRNAVALDNDVDRALRRRTGPVDQHRPANDERLEGPFAFVSSSSGCGD